MSAFPPLLQFYQIGDVIFRKINRHNGSVFHPLRDEKRKIKHNIKIRNFCFEKFQMCWRVDSTLQCADANSGVEPARSMLHVDGT